MKTLRYILGSIFPWNTRGPKPQPLIVIVALLACGFALPSPLPLVADDDNGSDEQGFVDLFNGRDLTGWVNVNCAPDTFTVADGMIQSTGVPTGIMRTDRMYENFILELDWRHMKEGGNAGLFVWANPITARGTPFARAIEVQILDGQNTENYTSHGDLFSIHGARFHPDRPHPNGWERCLPSERRCKPAGEWNHYRVVCNDGVIKLSVNGKEVSGGTECTPRKGYLCLESEGSPCHFRNIRIKELPSTDPKPEEVALDAEGFRPLYTGVDLSGWKTNDEHATHWKPSDWRLACDGAGPDDELTLRTTDEFADCELIVDWRLTGKAEEADLPVILPSGDFAKDDDGNIKRARVPDAGYSGILLRGKPQSTVGIWCWSVGSGGLDSYRTSDDATADLRAAVTPAKKADAPLGQWNRFHITLVGDTLSVDLNGVRVIDKAQLPDLPKRGPIGLAYGKGPIEFASILVKGR